MSRRVKTTKAKKTKKNNLTPEFKEMAVKKYQESKNYAATARELGINIGSLRNWVKKVDGPVTTPETGANKKVENNDDFFALVERKRKLETELAEIKANLIKLVG